MQLADRPILVLLILLILLPVAAEIGHRLSPVGEDNPRATQMSTATLALLGLLIAFTFSMASERFNSRRQLVVDEANAISTTYLRYKLLDEPYRSQLTGEMATYVAYRRAFDAAGVDQLLLARNLAATQGLQGRIWDELGPALRAPPGQSMVVSLLTSTNQMFDLAASRNAAAEVRVPRGVKIALVIFAIIAALGVGWSLGGEWRRHPGPALVLFVLIALATTLIADLDQPGAGFIKVPQGAMEKVAAQILRERADVPRPATTAPDALAPTPHPGAGPPP